MRTATSHMFHSNSDWNPHSSGYGSRDNWVISFVLPWFVIHIELPRTRSADMGARHRRPAMAESSPGAAADASHGKRPSAANGWRRGR